MNRPLGVTGLALALTLAGCTPAPSGLVVSGTVEDRLETVVVPAANVPAVNLDAGFTSLSGSTSPVTGRTSPRLSTAASTYGLGTFVRLADVTVASGDTVTVGQSLGRIDTSALAAQGGAAKADAAVAAAQVGLLADAIDTTYDKQADVEDAKAKVSDAIDRIHSGRAKLLKARATLRKNLPRARQGLAQVEAAIAGIPPTFPVPEALRAKQKQLTAAVRAMEKGLEKINATLPTLANGLRKASAGLRRLNDALATIADARGSLRDLKELAELQAKALKVPIDVVRAQLALSVFSSPVDGVVVEAASPGAILAPGATAVSIRESRPSTITAWLSPGQLAQVCQGDPATITGDWMPAGTGVQARLTVIGTRADYPPTSVATEEIHLTRAVEVHLTPTDQLPAGMPVELTISSCRPAAGTTDSDR